MSGKMNNNTLTIKSRFSILAKDNIVEIEFKDDQAVNAGIVAKIPYKDFMEALGTRLVGQECEGNEYEILGLQ